MAASSSLSATTILIPEEKEFFYLPEGLEFLFQKNRHFGKQIPIITTIHEIWGPKAVGIHFVPRLFQKIT